jgi:DNA polymerase elongation subunit (family B)
MKKYIINIGSLKQEKVGKNVNLICVSNEKELLMKFHCLIRKLNPHLLIGYNIFGFDIPYMIERCKLHNIYSEFNILGIPHSKHAVEKEIKWSSQAYAYQEFHYLDTEGRIFIDLLPVVKRDYKFNNYKLKTVSSFFLGETKDPLTALDIFKAYSSRNEEGGIEKLSECAKYCVQDGVLVLKLYKVLQLWIGLTEMAKICNVPIMYLFTKGQQIKVFSQVYKKCYDDNIIVESKIEHTILTECKDYAGAYVFDPEPGLYNWVVPFDFSSLYPTIIIAYNIDYSTLVLDESKVDLNQCNVLEWEDHLNCGCEKDESKHKKSSNKKILCKKHRYVFKKEPIGVIPALLVNLLNARSETKKLMKSLKQNKELSQEAIETQMTVYDKRQLAYKVSANSMYGGMGVQKGYLPFMPGAMSVTAMGRENIKKAAQYVKEHHQGLLIYGDSVLGQTPITIRKHKELYIFKIEDLFNDYETRSYPQFKSEDDSLSIKEQSIPNEDIYVYSMSGWSRVRRIIRHLTSKKIYRIRMTTGVIDVTEDHSLITQNGDLKKPKELLDFEELAHLSHCEFWNQTHLHMDIKLLNQIEILSNGVIHIKLDYIEYSRECMILYLFFYQKFENLYLQVQKDNSLFLIPNQWISPSHKKMSNLSILQNSTYISEESKNGIVLSIELLYENTSQYVYDIETEDGSFHAGIGNIIVKNTDSIYCHFEKYQNALTTWNKAKAIEVELLQLFPKPMKLVFEEKIYKKFLILTKKRYMAYTCDDKGVIDSDLTIRGVLLARRDNCKWIRDFYESIVRAIMDNSEKSIIYEMIQEKILDLFQWKIKNRKSFTVSKLVNKDYKIKLLPTDIKKCQKRFEDLDIRDIKLTTEEIQSINQKIQENTIPNHLLWLNQYIYKSKPAHIQLSEKMKNRGKPVEIGSRIEYLIITHPDDPKAKLFDKLEDPDYFKMHRDVLRLDRLYYLKNLTTPLDQLLNVVYKEKDFVSQLYNLYLQHQKIMEQIENYPQIVFDNEIVKTPPLKKSNTTSQITKSNIKSTLLKMKTIYDFY